MDDNQQYLHMFLDESSENIQRLGDLCLQMERGDTSDEVFAEVFRAAHTLKGMSATMGFSEMAQLTHALEDALGFLRERGEGIEPEALDLLFNAVEGLEQTLDSISSNGQETAVSKSLVDGLRAVASNQSVQRPSHSAASAPKIQEAPSAAGMPLLNVQQIGAEVTAVLESLNAQGIRLVQVEVRLAEGCMMKGPRAIMVMNAVDQIGDCMFCLPAATELEAGSFDGPFTLLVALTGASPEDLVAAIEGISEVEKAACSEWQATTASTGSVETTAKTSGAKPKTESTRTAAEQTIRVPVERLDRLMNLLSELVIDKTRLNSLSGAIANSDLKQLSEHMGRVSSDLQSTVMSLRMVPVETLFQRFPRMIRDLSKSLGKDIALEMSGGDTELDRTVIDEMGEALVHLLRNAADHGLEHTAERVAAGKPATGHLRLNAFPSGQNVLIEVSDDGQGIDVERVRAKAVERGLAPAEVAANWTDEEVYQMLFASGFSTAEQVSDISGRGVGMDAVKMKVERLGGTVYVQSVWGKGTTVTVQLPLTLSILQALLVRIGREDFAIPLSGIEEVIVVEDSELETVQGETFLRYRDKLVPIFDSGLWLNGQSTLGDAPWLLVICKDGDRNVAIAIDDLHHQQEIVHKPLGAYLSDVNWFSGATILGDGRIALIIDVHAWNRMRASMGKQQQAQ